MSNKNRTVAVNQGFPLTTDVERNASCFDISGAGIGFGAGFGFFFIVLSSAMVIAILPFFLVLFLPISCFVCVYLVVRRRKFKFTITDSEVRIGRKHYAQQDITEVLLRHKDTILHEVQSNHFTSSSMIMVGTGAAGVGLMAANSLNRLGDAVGRMGRNMIEKSIAMRNYEVCIRHGRKVVPLAKYLAIALYNKVTEVL